jgi:hypothetical protein
MSKTATQVWTRGNRLVGYDLKLRRVWIGGQRLHHGVTGALIAHDWKDRTLWFKRGPQAAA